MLDRISEVLAQVTWEGAGRDRVVGGFPQPIPPDWPLAEKLDRMMELVYVGDVLVDPAKPDSWPEGRPEHVGEHVKAVVASVNQLLDPRFRPDDFLVKTNNYQIDNRAESLLMRARSLFWIDRAPLFVSYENPFVNGILRAAALYHDIGALVSRQRHVSRGVHLMRDVSRHDRTAVETMFSTAKEKRDFWSLLYHHDIYGMLCTGEASLPALADMVGWAFPEEGAPAADRSTIAYLSYLVLLNMADSNARLLRPLGGITTIEASRYLKDWDTLKNYLLRDRTHPENVKREQFKSWLIETASHPDETIVRLTRLVATCYRIEMRDIAPEREIQEMVEQELQALLGARMEKFCYCFARFCKLDYALRFFSLLMRRVLKDAGLLTRSKNASRTAAEFEALEPVPAGDVRQEARNESCRAMVNETCLVLQRIVEDYAELVDRQEHASPLLGVDMTGLTRYPQAAWAICKALAVNSARALWWIAKEVGIWLYGE